MFGVLNKKLKQKCRVCHTQLEERRFDPKDDATTFIYCPSCKQEVDDYREVNYIRNNTKKIGKPKRGGKRDYEEWT